MNPHPLIDSTVVRLAAANPIDERRLTDRVAPFTDDVIAEFTGGTAPAPAHADAEPVAATRATPTRRGVRRPWPLVAAAACVAVLAATAALAGVLPGSSEPAYAITLDGDVIVVNWTRDLRDGSAIAEELRAYGVDVTVRAVPASPSQVGRVLLASVDGVASGEVPRGVSWGADGTDDVFTWRIDPSRLDESIEMEIGVEPDAGEPYVAAASAFAPGEVLGGLHCALGEPISAGEVDRQLRRLDVDIRWFQVTEAAGSVDGDLAEEAPSRTPPAGTVIDVQPIDSHTVAVRVAPPGALLTKPIFTPVRPSAECTPAVARRWIADT